jgi:hypothetical protein
MKKWLFFAVSVCLLFLLVGVAASQEKREGYITGKIVSGDGENMSGWRIRFYDAKAGPTPFTTEYGRVPDFIARSEDDGVFKAKLPEGIYHMIALKKGPGKRLGPAEEGDLIYPSLDSTEPKSYIIKAGATTDIGVISGAVPFKKEWAVQVKTGIEGTVLDAEGKPVEGVLVFAALRPEVEIPLYASRVTDKDGKYLIGLPEGGQYYVSVWKEKPITVTVKRGEITKGIDISVTRSRGR